MTRLLVVRHGQASWGTSNYDELSPLGVVQSQRLGTWLSGRGRRFDAIWTGPLQRQRDTARHLADAAAQAGLDLPPPRIDDSLCELPVPAMFKRGYPQLDTRALEERYPDLQRRQHKVPSAEATAAAVGFLLEHWAKDGFDIGELETFSQFELRIRDALARIVNEAEDSASVLIVTSAGPLAMLVKHALSTSPGQTMRLSTAILNSSVTELERSASGLRMLAFNGTPHLAQDEVTSI